MKAKFIGDPANDGDGPKIMTHLGIRFPKDSFVGIPDELVEKIRGNNHFEVAEGDAPAAPEPKPEPKAKGKKAKGKKGKAEGDAPADTSVRDGLINRLAALGTEYDPEASAEDLAALLEVAEFEAGED